MYRSDQADDEPLPCVIQIRLNGLKGVLVNSPELSDRGVLIQYRPSQHKFDASHDVLEIAKHFTSGKISGEQRLFIAYGGRRDGLSQSASDCSVGEHGRQAAHLSPLTESSAIENLHVFAGE